MEALGQLSATITHDFNNALAVISSASALLKRHLEQETVDPKIDSLLQSVQHGTSLAASLTKRLLAFSCCQTLEPRRVNVNGLIKNSVMLLVHTLGDEIDITQQFDSALEEVYIDPVQLEVALLNLAINAKDAMAGRGTLIITTENSPVAPSGFPGSIESFICVTIRDTGCGMDEEVLAKAFEPFFTTKKVGSGTGLGLSQVYEFIRQSGGHIHIDSEVGSGCSVRLFLPRAKFAS
jgi:signal transduction histidine kinase